MTSKEALEIFYKDVKNYNNDMRKYPAYYFDKPKNEEMLRKWEIKQNEMYATILGDLEVLDEIKNLLDANTLCRLIGIKGYKVIDLFKTNKKIKEWLEK